MLRPAALRLLWIAGATLLVVLVGQAQASQAPVYVELAPPVAVAFEAPEPSAPDDPVERPDREVRGSEGELEEQPEDPEEVRAGDEAEHQAPPVDCVVVGSRGVTLCNARGVSSNVYRPPWTHRAA